MSAAKNLVGATSFSGSDMMVYFAFPEARPVYIGTASTVTYSTFRETRHVRTLSRISSKGVTRGGRTVAGTLIFTVINQHIVNDILDALREVTAYRLYDKLKPDELPPFDIIISFANEYGQMSREFIYGVSIVDDGMVLSIEDIFTENTMTYIARDISLMKASGADAFAGNSSYSFRGNVEATGSFQVVQAHKSAEYKAYIKQMKAFVAAFKNGGGR